MATDKLRRQILFEAARLMRARQETDAYKARLRAARTLCHGWVKSADLPRDSEIRQELQRLSSLPESVCEPLGEAASAESREADERFRVYRALLMPLEQVDLNRQRHPEGDALYHSLQVFQLAREEIPYDEEFLLAALLHDVGQGIDRFSPVEATLNALSGLITDRTAWLIANHADGHRIHDGSIGLRARRRLVQSPDYEYLLRLCACDRNGRVPGMTVPDVDEALAAIRALSESCG